MAQVVPPFRESTRRSRERGAQGASKRQDAPTRRISVKSWRTVSFRRAFARLPKDIQRQARQAYRRFSENPAQPGLQFKKVHPRRPIYSVRIGLGYRALGTKTGDDIVWFWIRSHADYDRLVS
jgi:hypothetical protein